MPATMDAQAEGTDTLVGGFRELDRLAGEMAALADRLRREADALLAAGVRTEWTGHELASMPGDLAGIAYMARAAGGTAGGYRLHYLETREDGTGRG